LGIGDNQDTSRASASFLAADLHQSIKRLLGYRIFSQQFSPLSFVGKICRSNLDCAAITLNVFSEKKALVHPKPVFLA